MNAPVFRYGLPVTLAVLVYAASVLGPFVFDDYQYIVENPNLNGPIQWRGAFTRPELLFGPGESIQYRPLLYLVNHANFRIAGRDPRGWHLLNVVLHSLNVALLVGLVTDVLRLQKVRAGPRVLDTASTAMWIGLLYAVHPFNAEAVAYISGRSALLATLLVVGAARCLVRALVRGEARSTDKAAVSLWAWGASSCGLLMLAALAHEAALVGGFVAISVVAAIRPTRMRSAVLLCVTIALLLCVLGIGQAVVTQAMHSRYEQESRWEASLSKAELSHVRADEPFEALASAASPGIRARLSPELQSLIDRYSRSGALVGLPILALWALTILHATYRVDRSVAFGASTLLCAALLIGGAVSLSAGAEPILSGLAQLPRYVLLVGYPPALNADPVSPANPPFLVVFGVLAAVWIAGIVLARAAATNPLSSVGGLWFLGSLVPFAMHWGAMASDRRMSTAGMGAALAVVGGTARIAVDWRPVSARRATILGVAILTILGIATLERVRTWSNPEALWEDVLRKAPNNYRALTNLAVARRRAGDDRGAAQAAGEAIRIRRDLPEAWNLHGTIQLKRGEVSSAIESFRNAIASTRRCQPEAANNLGAALLLIGEPTIAAEAFEAALLCPSASQVEILTNLGLAREAEGAKGLAAEAFDHALKIAPGAPKALAGRMRLLDKGHPEAESD